MAGSLIAGYVLSTTAAAAAAAGGLAAFQFAAVAFAANMVVGRVVSKIFAPGRQQQPEAGSRVQLPPATGNSLGVFYGSSWLKPVVSWASDAGNKRMYYVLDFGIAPETAHTITFGDIKWEGKTLNFDDQNSMLPPGPVYISGRSVGGALISISDNGIPIGSTTSESNGDWSYTGTFTDGVHNITATETYNDPYSGNPTTVSISDFSPKNFTITSNLSLIRPSPNVVSWRDSPSADFPEGYLDAKVANKIKVYRFTNGYNSSATNDPRTAIQILQDPTIPVDKRVDNNFLKSKTVFLIVELEYFEPAGITRLGEITVQLTNSISSPGSVMLDYLTNPYYGWGLPTSSVDTVSLSNLDDYANQMITYTYTNSSGVVVTGTRKRFTINGPVPSSNPVINNIREIADSCDCWVKFNETTGKWGVAINKGYDQAAGTIPAQTIGQLFSVNPDNMTGSISLGSLDLNSTYNRVEVSYVDYDQIDQAGYSYIDLDAVDRNPNEPDNTLSINLPYVNTYAQAKLIGQRKLIQSRENAAINSLLIDWSGIQLEPGDVIRISDSVYNWNDKLFKVLQVTEVNDSESGLHASLNVMEYSEQSYQDVLDISDYAPVPNTGFDNPDITVRPDAPYFSNLQPSIVIPEFTVNAIVPSLGVYNAIELWFSTDPNPADITKYSKYATVFSVGGNAFTPGSTVQQIYTGAPAGDYFAVSRAVTLSGEYSGYSNPSLRLAWAPSIESVAGFTTEVIPAAVFCSADFNGGNVVVGQTVTLTVRSGPNIVTVWDKTGVQPDNTWYGDNLTTSAGLTTGLLLTDTVNNTVYFTVTGLTVDVATATIGDIYYKPSGLPLVNIGESVVQVSKVKNGTPGNDGKQYNTAYLYQWSPTTPSNPSGSSTFVWATGSNTLYTGAGGWTVDIPANPGTPGMKLWISSKSVDDLGGVTSTAVSWASGYAVSQYTQNGATGDNGLQTSYPEVYQWTAGGTPTIAGSSTYTWATGTFTPTPAGWSTSIPTSPSAGYTLWAAKITIVETGGVLTSNIDWTTSSIVSVGYAGNDGGPGTPGLNGTRTAILDVYQWSSTVPTTFPSGTSTYTWATSQFTMPSTTNGWSLTSGSGSAGQTLYIARQTYADTDTTATSSVIWSTVNPIAIGVYGSNGAPGAPGESVYTADVFIQSATAPTAPSGGSYNFSTGVLVAPASWSITQPSTTTTPTYAVSYTFRTTTPGTTVSGGTWTDVRIVAVSGSSGGDGTSVFVGSVYLQQAAEPTAPSGGSYNFSTNVQVAPTGWVVSQPTSTTTPTWLSYYTFSTTTPGTTVAGGSYSTPIIDAQNGAPGTDGLNGNRTALLEVYQWAASAPTTFPSGSSTYTWATGEFTLPATPNSWSLTPGAATAGYTLWATRVVYSDSLTTATSSVTWPATNSAYAVGAAGTNGGTGNQGASARRAYSRIPGNPSPTSGQVTVVGDGRPTSAQSNTTWGLNYSWTATDPDTTSTDSLFQSDGVYDPATGNTVWDTPYLSSLRVGTLSAITTNTGDLTVSGQILAGTAAISGNTMTGAGSIIYSDGKFAMGTPTSYIVNNGTEVFISGFDTVASSSSTLLAISGLNPGTVVGSVALDKPGKGTVRIDGYITVYFTSATVFNYYDVTIRFGWKNTVQPSLAISMLSVSQAAVFRNPSANEYVMAFPVSAQLPLNFSIADTYSAYIQKVGVGLWNAAGTPTNVTNTATVVWNGWAAFNQTRI